MKTSVKMALATGAVGVAGALFLVGSSYADRFGPPFGMGGAHGMGPGGPIVHEMLAEVDTNGDGALSQDEINLAIDARFTQFDANSDGSLSLEEFQALWARHHPADDGAQPSSSSTRTAMRRCPSRSSMTSSAPWSPIWTGTVTACSAPTTGPEAGVAPEARDRMAIGITVRGRTAAGLTSRNSSAFRPGELSSAPQRLT